MIKRIVIKRIAIVLAGILVVLLGKGLFYYSWFYFAPPSEMPSYEHIVIPQAPSTEFSDVYKKGEGTILIDLAHYNNFDVEELNVLTLRLISRGLTIEFLSPGDNLKRELSQADAFIIVCPQRKFTEEEGENIDEFVNNGGKLLLIADPTRPSQINSLSLDFGLIFEPDYLYNMKENEINYRNIFVTEFKENKITKDIEKIAFYTAGSISSAEGGIAFVDENTFSNVIETRKRLSPIALVQEAKVLAIHDLTFITEPHNGILDNNQLISNIADWLASP
ncbi:MAG: hypothetical protein QMC90_04520 [Dehalococcoidales bacterium]|nr:hypothetical protein [Dehalococcoidales bacterium]